MVNLTLDEEWDAQSAGFAFLRGSAAEHAFSERIYAEADGQQSNPEAYSIHQNTLPLKHWPEKLRTSSCAILYG